MSSPRRTPTPHVRGAGAADAGAIGEVHAEAWRVAYSDVLRPEVLAEAVSRRRSTGATLTAQLVEDHEPRLQDGSTLLVVAVGERVVGFAHASRGRPGAPGAEVHAFYVHPGSWGTGVADVLWDGVLSRLRPDPGVPSVLWTLEGAARARAFYERRGWLPTGRRRDHDFGLGEAVAIVEYRSP